MYIYGGMELSSAIGVNIIIIIMLEEKSLYGPRPGFKVLLLYIHVVISI